VWIALQNVERSNTWGSARAVPDPLLQETKQDSYLARMSVIEEVQKYRHSHYYIDFDNSNTSSDKDADSLIPDRPRYRVRWGLGDHEVFDTVDCEDLYWPFEGEEAFDVDWRMQDRWVRADLDDSSTEDDTHSSSRDSESMSDQKSSAKTSSSDSDKARALVREVEHKNSTTTRTGNSKLCFLSYGKC